MSHASSPKVRRGVQGAEKMARFQRLSQDDRGVLGPGTRVDSDTSHTGLLGIPTPHSSPPSSSGASHRGYPSVGVHSRPHPETDRIDISERLPGNFKDPNLLLQTKHCVAKWFAPGCLFFVCLMAQNFGLYIGTYYYIMWMDRLHDTIDDPLSGSAANLRASHHAGQGLHSNETELELLRTREELSSTVGEGALQDVFADMLGRQTVSTSLLDCLSGSTPLLLLITTAICRDLRLWTKCCVCGSLMALLKGFLAWATVVPDSIGWDGCKKRLGEHGLEFFRSKSGLNFETEFMQSLVDVLNLELWGVSNEGKSHHLRFCADMMFSGHTYVCATFSLGLFSLFRSRTAGLPVTWRTVGRFLVGSALFAIVFFDVIMILINRFHYTMDVTIALVLVALLFSNPAVAVVAEFWVEYTGEREALADWRDRDDFRDHGTVLVPPCCFPLCCFTGRYYLHGYPDQHETFHRNLHTVQEQFDAQLHDMQKQLADQRQLAQDSQRRLREAEGVSDSLRTSLDKAEQLRQDADKEAVTARATLHHAKRRSCELESNLEELRISRQADLDSKQGELDLSKKELESERLARILAQEQARELSVKLETLSNAPSSMAEDSEAVDSGTDVPSTAAVTEELDAVLVERLKVQMAAPVPPEGAASAEVAAAAAAPAANPAPAPDPEASAKVGADPLAPAPLVGESVHLAKVEPDVPMTFPELPAKEVAASPADKQVEATGPAPAIAADPGPGTQAVQGLAAALPTVDPTAGAFAGGASEAVPESAPESTPEVAAQPSPIVIEQAPLEAAATTSEPVVADPTAPAATAHQVDPTAAATPEALSIGQPAPAFPGDGSGGEVTPAAAGAPAGVVTPHQEDVPPE